jgi:hypothetical protein
MATKFLDSDFSNFVLHKIAESETGEVSGITYNYYLYIHPRGQAIIMREESDGSEYRYADGGRGDSRWADRQTLEYKDYDNLVK